MIRMKDIVRANDSYYAREYEPIIRKEKETSKAEGMAKGTAKTTEKHVLSCFSKGMAPEDIADLLEVPITEVKAILNL